LNSLTSVTGQVLVRTTTTLADKLFSHISNVKMCNVEMCYTTNAKVYTTLSFQQFGQKIRKCSKRTGALPYTSGRRTLSCFGAMDRKFDSVFLPSVVHGLAPVIADVKSGNVGLLQISGAQTFWLVGHICLSETIRGPQELIISIKILQKILLND